MSVYESLYIELRENKQLEFIRRIESVAHRTTNSRGEPCWVTNESGIYFYAGLTDGQPHVLSFNYRSLPLSVIQAIVGRTPIFRYMAYCIEQDAYHCGGWLSWAWAMAKEWYLTRRETNPKGEKAL